MFVTYDDTRIFKRRVLIGVRQILSSDPRSGIYQVLDDCNREAYIMEDANGDWYEVRNPLD